MNRILNKIVESEGSCTSWAKPSICAQCPLSQLRRKSNGSNLSCIEAVGATDMTEEEADARYKEVATRILLDEALDEILGDPDVTK